MNREHIRADVVETARRFGDRNPQESKRLERIISRADLPEAVHGLLAVFTEPTEPHSVSNEQELAGKLLAALPALPAEIVPLDAVLRAALPHYDRSVEQFPRYLARVHGDSVVIGRLDALLREQLTDGQRAAAETMAWWLRGRVR